MIKSQNTPTLICRPKRDVSNFFAFLRVECIELPIIYGRLRWFQLAQLLWRAFIDTGIANSRTVYVTVEACMSYFLKSCRTCVYKTCKYPVHGCTVVVAYVINYVTWLLHDSLLLVLVLLSVADRGWQLGTGTDPGFTNIRQPKVGHHRGIRAWYPGKLNNSLK